jgi:hypothetical protein
MVSHLAHNQERASSISPLLKLERNVMAEKVKLMFDGVEKECLVQTDRNGEITCTARDGRFVKFPKGTKLNVATIKRHNKANSIKPNPPGTEEANAEELAKWLKK